MVSATRATSSFMEPPSMETELEEIENKPKAPPTVAQANSLIETDLEEALDHFNQYLSASDTLSPSDHFKALVGRGEAYLRKGTPEDLPLARQDFEAALKLLVNPDSQLIGVPWKRAEILKNLALISKREGKLEEASARFKEGWEACKSHKTLALDYARFLKDYQKDLKSALTICDHMLTVHPDSSDFLYTRAKIYFAAEDWVKTLQDCTCFLSINKIKKVYRLEMLDLAAEACLKVKKYAAACDYMQRACGLEGTVSLFIERSKKLLETRLSLIPSPLVEILNSKHWKSVRTYPERALKIADFFLNRCETPDFLFLVLMIRAIACIGTKRPENLISARQNLEQALQLLINEQEAFSEEDKTPFRKMDVFGNLALICVKENKLEEALKYYKEEYEVNKDGEVFFKLVDFLKKTEPDLAPALALCEQRIKEDPQRRDVHGLYSRAKIYFSLGKWEEAYKDCLPVLQRAISQAYCLEILDLAAEACLKMGDYTAAYGYIKEAYELDTSSRLIERFNKLLEVSKMVGTAQTAIDAPVERDLSHELKAALNNEDPKDALKLFDHLLVQKLPPLDRCIALLGAAKACINIKENIKETLELDVARQNLREALSLLSGDGGSPSEISKKKSEVFHCLARLNICRGAPQEALQDFKRAWSFDKTVELLQDYFGFLTRQGDFREALNLCLEGEKYKVINEVALLYFQNRIFFAKKDDRLVIESCDSLLGYRFEHDSMRVNVLKRAFQASMNIEDYERAKKYALEACELDDSSTFIERLEDFLAAHKAEIVRTHIDDRLRRPDYTQIPYLSALLQAYQAELAHHSRSQAHLFTERGKLYAKEKDFAKAIQDYEAALRVLNAKPMVFNPKDLAYIQSLLKAVRR